MILDEDVRIRTEIDADDIDAGFVPQARPEVAWVALAAHATGEGSE